MTKRLNVILIVMAFGLVALTVALAVAIRSASYVEPLPWCTYPDPAGVSALHIETATRMAQVHRWSPDMPVDAQTVTLLTMAECGRNDK